MIITLANCALIISAFFIDDEDVIAVFELLDKIFFGIYVFEMLIKQLAYGLEEYFGDDWLTYIWSYVLNRNKFDFFLIVF